MKTLKFSLKRKISGVKIRKLERDKVFNSIENRNRKFTEVDYSQPKSIGKKYNTTIYELEDQANNQQISKAHYKKKYFKPCVWIALEVLKSAKNSNQNKRVYKLYPNHDPKVRRKLKHESEVAAWRERLKRNENATI